MDFKSAVLFGVVGLIIDYLIINYGIPMIFPNVYKYNKIQNKLDVSLVNVPLTMGACNFDSSMVELNTSNPFGNGFVYMPHSNNLKGGVQFSYSMWLDVKAGTNLLQNKIIFTKGLKHKVFNDVIQSLDYLVKCPLVKFGSLETNNEDSSYLIIQFNSMKNPHNEIKLNNNVFNLTKSTRSNPRWFLITLVFQDYIDFSNAEKGIQIQSFINDNLVSTEIIKNDSLKINSGNVFITPTQQDIYGDKIDGDAESFYADLTYYNYALNIIDIEKIYSYGVSNESGCVTAKYTSQSKIKDSYHKLSMNNYLQY